MNDILIRTVLTNEHYGETFKKMKSIKSLASTLSLVVSNTYVILLPNFIEENACVLGEYHLIADFFLLFYNS